MWKTSVLRTFNSCSTTTHHTPLIIHHSSYTTHHTPLIIHHSSYTTHHTPLIRHHSSYTTHQTPLIIHHSSYTTHHTPLIIHHSSYTTHHTPLILHHSSYTTHHTPLIIHHSSFVAGAIQNALRRDSERTKCCIFQWNRWLRSWQVKVCGTTVARRSRVMLGSCSDHSRNRPSIGIRVFTCLLK